ncbi:hypothetical protein OKW43_007876 [Paraburkholderia sp. WC7.3g]|uniref:hypothetical protein n=1 Tax=Paraburkholderia sp. WC7.3g TaxID=2991070 RepID=UPI003D215CC7
MKSAGFSPIRVARSATALYVPSRNIGERLALDYAGIDFTILPDGRVFVFEANATMLVHYERDDGPLKHKNGHVQRIVDAFEQMMIRRSLSHAGPRDLRRHTEST